VSSLTCLSLLGADAFTCPTQTWVFYDLVRVSGPSLSGRNMVFPCMGHEDPQQPREQTGQHPAARDESQDARRPYEEWTEDLSYEEDVKYKTRTLPRNTV